MNDVVALGAKSVNDPLGHSRVGEESQVSSFLCLRDVDFLLSQPRSIFHCLVNILRFEIRVVLEDFLLGRAVSDLANDGRNKDTHAAYACPATHDVGIERYAVKHRYPTPLSVATIIPYAATTLIRMRAAALRPMNARK